MTESFRERLWRGEWPLVARALGPFEQLYGLGAAIDRRFGRRSSQRVDVPVLSVGNLVAGGAGKTPVTLLLARRLRADGHRVGVVSRGFGRRSRGLVVVARGEGSVAAAADAGGDEPVLLARKEPGLVVVVAERRVEAARACVSMGCDVVVMDDGFSHHEMHRDLDVLVVDASLGFGNGRMLPAGPLREPLSEARRAGLVWISKADADSALPEPVAGMPVVRSDWRPVGLCDASLRLLAPPTSVSGRRVAAFCAIARPESFRRTLVSLGAEVVHFASFADHQTPSPAALMAFRSAARAAGAERLVCTEKDLVRLDAGAAEGIEALAMEARLIGDSGPLNDALVKALVRLA